MKLAVTHLTRMAPGYICVAGVQPETCRHIRPTLVGRLTSDLLVRNGGPFDMACEVELGPVRDEGRPPELEDRQFTRANAVRLRDVPPDEFWTLLESMALPDLTSDFGADLKEYGHSCVVDVGKGRCSLGCLKLKFPPILMLDNRNRIRVLLYDGRFNVDLSLSDLRFYEDDYQTPRRDLVQKAAFRIGRGVPLLLGVGLTRPFQKDPSQPEYHWLQVNAIHLADDSAWRLG